ncbi:hypothetical protein UFOVP571_54 [uncultured Caudovirales phage]|uniref:Uncharacterized protein n=1 Tax=uncultured Caudovirales phage TaxID=2100421 RepID=A0A6J5MW65_9CAUD|nr:hypothetical protein UFOVP571_54 [uncultured Caudovirales phage]
MKNKIIFCTIAAILALIVNPIIGFVNDAKDCKFELENFKQAELNNKKIISTQKTYAKKIKENLSDGDINYRLQLLKQINPSD